LLRLGRRIATTAVEFGLLAGERRALVVEQLDAGLEAGDARLGLGQVGVEAAGGGARGSEFAGDGIGLLAPGRLSRACCTSRSRVWTRLSRRVVSPRTCASSPLALASASRSAVSSRARLSCFCADWVLRLSVDLRMSSSR